MQKLIERYKAYRKKKFLNIVSGYSFRYAFIGTGQHSISNLYPVLHHLGVPLKKICTLHAVNAQQMAARFPDCTGTANLQDILDDESIRGVFVSAHPSNHFPLAEKLLLAGKNVFVEKPPCLSLQELQSLIKNRGNLYCMPGLQKRFSTINKWLGPYCKKTCTYSYRYLTGPYPEGNPIMDLFIHPIDNILQLFGDVTAIELLPSHHQRTLFLACQHANGTTGSIQLSTDHSWSEAVDELEVNTSSSIFKASYPFKLTSTEKSATVFSIPLEKVFKKPSIQKVYVNNTGFVPTDTNNSVYLQGFAGEIEHFLKMTEAGKSTDAFDIASLERTYRLLEKINQ